MAEGQAEKQRDEETLVGPQEGGTKDQVARGVPAGGCRWLQVAVGICLRATVGHMWEVQKLFHLPLSFCTVWKK